LNHSLIHTHITSGHILSPFSRAHRNRASQVLVFSDNLFALQDFAHRLHRPYISGNTSQREREDELYKFKTDPNKNCLLISKIGDNSLDMPAVNVIIQVLCGRVPR
jgi:DNA excision repair protein ERCC-3